MSPIFSLKRSLVGKFSAPYRFGGSIRIEQTKQKAKSIARMAGRLRAMSLTIVEKIHIATSRDKCHFSQKVASLRKFYPKFSFVRCLFWRWRQISLNLPSRVQVGFNSIEKTSRSMIVQACVSFCARANVVPHKISQGPSNHKRDDSSSISRCDRYSARILQIVNAIIFYYLAWGFEARRAHEQRYETLDKNSTNFAIEQIYDGRWLLV